MDEDNKRKTQFSIVYILLGLGAMWLFQGLIFRPLVVRETEVSYRQFLEELEAGEISQVTIGGDRVVYSGFNESGEVDETALFNAVIVEDPDLVTRLLDAGVDFEAEPPTNNILTSLLGWIIPFLPLVLIWFLLFRRMGQGGGPGVMSFGNNKAKEIPGELTGIKFEDVGGIDEVAVELIEIIDFLKDPERFTRLGAKLPKGVLLVGPPGTGKTLLAKATAGEAGVPFFSISGSDFVEMFVGVGAARVRNLFEQAKAKAPVIIFIDEIDAIGQSRASGMRIGTNDEREQTLNQLLAEMDGFQTNEGVIIMGATNRPEILDQALLRPGRFDRQIQVPLPTEPGRRKILEIHSKDVKLAPEMDLKRISQITPGFSGADLANIVNEAALLAIRRNREEVNMDDFDLAIERVVAGLQRKMPLKDEVRLKVAYHEGGHALVAQVLTHTDPVHKVSIIPTAKGALGYTMQMPEEDQYLVSESEIKEKMAVMMGGRAAELLVYDEASTGASNDLERVTMTARRLVTEFGMTEALGPVRYANNVGLGGGYLNNVPGMQDDLSPETATLIDREVRRLVDESQDLALDLLRTHEAALHEVAEVLMEKEVISGEDIKEIAAKHSEVSQPVTEQNGR